MALRAGVPKYTLDHKHRGLSESFPVKPQLFGLELREGNCLPGHSLETVKSNFGRHDKLLTATDKIQIFLFIVRTDNRFN